MPEESIFWTRVNEALLGSGDQNAGISPDAKMELEGEVPGTGVHVAVVRRGDQYITIIGHEGAHPEDEPYTVTVPEAAVDETDGDKQVPVGQPQTLEHFLGAKGVNALTGIGTVKVNPYASGFADVTSRSPALQDAAHHGIVTIELYPNHTATIGMGDHRVPIQEYDYPTPSQA